MHLTEEPHFSGDMALHLAISYAQRHHFVQPPDNREASCRNQVNG